MHLFLLNPLVSPKHPDTFVQSHLSSSPNPNISFLQSKNPSRTPPTRKISKLCCSNSTETCSEERSEEKEPTFFRLWDVPWDWRVISCVMAPYLMSIVFTGVVESSGLEGMQRPHPGDILTQLHSTDEVAIRMFMDQLLKSVVKLSILYVFVNQHRPFPDGIFTLRWDKPLNPHDGWILWAGGGLIIASTAVFLLKIFISSPTADQAPNEAESLVRLLPLIGSSSISTACLLGILGVIAPICEETLYRGFFLTSLTKWFPLPVSVALSSAAFALAHQSPGKFLEIFVFGITLGVIYARTRNLLVPISMHACWNSGVILLLTYLHNQGQDIRQHIL